MKVTILFVLFIIQTAFTQYSNRSEDYDYDAVHAKIDLLIFETNTYIAQNSKCLCNLYKDLEAGKQISTFGNFECGSRSPLEAITESDEKNLEIIRLQFPSYYQSISNTTFLFNDLNKLLQTQQLNKTNLDTLLLRFEHTTNTFKLESEKISKEKQQKTLAKLPPVLKEYVLEERQFIDTNKFFLRASLQGNFPSKALLNNLHKTDSLLQEITKLSHKDKKLQQVVSNLKAHQANKKDFLFKVEYDLLLSSDFRNEFYFQIHNYFNNGIIPALKIFYHASYGLTSVYNPYNNLTNVPVNAPTFHNCAVVPVGASNQKNKLNKQSYNLLTEHINLLNQSIQSNNFNAVILHKFEKELKFKRKIASYKLSLNINKSCSYLALEASTQQINRLLGNSNQNIANQSLALSQMLADCYSTYNLIKTEFNLHNVHENNFAKYSELLEKYKGLLENINRQIKYLNQSIEQYIAESVQDNPESGCSLALYKYCISLKSLIEDAENNIDQEDVSLLHTEMIEKTRQQTIDNATPLLAAIDQTEYMDIYSLPSLYKELTEQAEQMQQKYKYLSDNSFVPFKKGCCEGYSALLNAYNSTLMYMNEFSRMSAQKSNSDIYNPMLLYQSIQLP